jgi:hypothetical protein
MQKDMQKPNKETQEPKKDQEEEEGQQGNGEYDIEEIPLLVGENRKEHLNEQSMHKHKKRKFVNPVEIQALIEENLEKVRDQVKEVNKEAFM